MPYEVAKDKHTSLACHVLVPLPVGENERNHAGYSSWLARTQKHTEETLRPSLIGRRLIRQTPEYPRPRMQRDNYVMNGVWDYTIVPVNGD